MTELSFKKTTGTKKFPNQCKYILVDGIRSKFYKCDLCLESKSLITCGARNTKDAIRKHHQHNHDKLFTASGSKRQSELVGPVDQKKLKTSDSRFQISHLDKTAKEDFGKKVAIWQASSDIPYNAIDSQEFSEVLKSFAGQFPEIICIIRSLENHVLLKFQNH